MFTKLAYPVDDLVDLHLGRKVLFNVEVNGIHGPVVRRIDEFIVPYQL